MAKRASHIPALPLQLDPAAALPLHRQLYLELRGAILGGQLRPGTRLPATRGFAQELGVARGTVVNAYEQLRAEGYLEALSGSATVVARTLPEELLTARSVAPPPLRPPRPGLPSNRGAAMADALSRRVPDHGAPRPFWPMIPAVDEFPIEIWRRIVAQVYRSPSAHLLGYGDPAGFWPLREAIADYLATARAVRCTAEQVIVVAGSQQANDLAARALLDVGDTVWVEDPLCRVAYGVLRGAGAQLVPVPVDGEGLDVAEGIRRAPGARLVSLTPSHQYPLGVTMSLPRRLALLDWAASRDAWLIEDDYDADYRYVGPPLASLQGLDAAGRTIYIGSFSKTIFPGLRLGYLVAPPNLVEPIVAALTLASRHPPALDQVVLAEFLAGGHFGRHLRRMRALYAERRDALLSAAEPHRERLRIDPVDGGLHAVGWLAPDADDRAVARRALERGLRVTPLAPFYVDAPARPGLLLGFTALAPAQIRQGMRQLIGVI
jgi:GntR family transcriptional regulator / MocR family aminotransferase